MSARNSFVGLTGDEIFHEAANPPWLLEGMDESSGNYCWQKQETLKGSLLPGGTAYGGWRFHEWESGLNPDNYVMTNAHYSASQAAVMVVDGSITNNPVFNRGFEPMFDHDMSQDDQWLALAKYVPAVGMFIVEHRTNESLDCGFDKDGYYHSSDQILFRDRKDVLVKYKDILVLKDQEL